MMTWSGLLLVDKVSFANGHKTRGFLEGTKTSIFGNNTRMHAQHGVISRTSLQTIRKKLRNKQDLVANNNYLLVSISLRGAKIKENLRCIVFKTLEVMHKDHILMVSNSGVWQNA